MQLVDCTYSSHAAAMLDILNEVIRNSTAIYEYHPRPPDSMIEWFKAKEAGRFPVIGAVNERRQLMGFASYGTFRAWPAYKYSVEHSVYVDARFREQGIGKALLRELVAAARQQDYHVLIGGIDAANSVSIRLHESLGFVHCGTIRQGGFKFGRWLDLAFYQLLLSTPLHPTDG